MIVEQWRRVSSTRPATGGAWVHSPPHKSPTNRGLLNGFLLSSLLFPARGGFHHDLQQKKTHKQSFFFLDLSSSSAFSLSVGFPSADGRSGGWEGFFFSSALGGWW
jgi:hypothetical protein